MAVEPNNQTKKWYEKLSRSGYFFGAVLFHLVLFLLVATWVIFPAFKPPTEDFTKTYLPPSSPPPPPPPMQQTVAMPTTAVSAPTTTITSPSPTATFSVPIPDITPSTTPTEMTQKMTQPVASTPKGIPSARLAKIGQTVAGWGRDRNNILESNSDPKNIKANFPVYLASYADGDWHCNVTVNLAGKIEAGSLPNLVAKINEWSHGNIKGEVVPEPLKIGGPELLEKKPPFIFFTGHKDFTLTDQEVKNLQDYLQVGGAIWGDNALAGWGSRFDVAFRREMKRVVPDIDKNFEPVSPSSDVFTKSWFPLSKVPSGMNYYHEPLEHLDIDGKLAIFYTPNDYSDMFWMRILPGDTTIQGPHPSLTNGSPLFTSEMYLINSTLFFRNFTLPSCLECDKLGMNVIGYLLVRFDKDLLLTP